MWVHDDPEAKVRRYTARNVLPGITAVIGTVESPMILQEQPLWPRFMERNLMHALSELWIFLRQEYHPYSVVARLRRGSAIVGAVDAAGGTTPRRTGLLPEERSE